ncbi:MAG: hypothetical protein LBK99_06605 [Opitutaceae bacterium]|jgi:hypothetical protein|nr:hypothetical protein [Opitutaceae bacterium]
MRYSLRLPPPSHHLIHFILILFAIATLDLQGGRGEGGGIPDAIGKWPPVPPVDFNRISVADFADEDLDLVTPLAHFAQIANAVRETGPDRGFIDIAVWRNPKDNRPYNARIMENVLSLAWFYTTRRDWNPYHGHPAVRVRLEAALDFIARIQASDGAFSEYGPRKWNLAATGFMTKFLGETLELLALPGAPGIDAGVLARAHTTQRRALVAALTRADFYASGSMLSNQYGNIWPGGLAWLHLHPGDTEIRTLWEKRFHQSRADFQSLSGFFYETRGPDFGYTLGTHGSNSRSAWPYLRGGPFAAEFLAKEKAWFEWLSYNAVLQPDADWFTINSAIETRQQFPLLQPHALPLSPIHPVVFLFGNELLLSNAFPITAKERQAGDAEERAHLARHWPGVAPLKARDFTAFSPYRFLYRRTPAFYPDEALRDKARATLPYLANHRFNHSRNDRRHGASFLYLRRPLYYATFASGKIAPRLPQNRQQRYGIGLLWRPDTGILFHGQSRKPDLAWGTFLPGQNLPFEAKDFHPQFRIEGNTVSLPLPDAADLTPGDLSVSYPLDIPDRKTAKGGAKTVTFRERSIHASIHLESPFEERFPLVLAPGETLEIEAGNVTIRSSVTGQPILRIESSGSPANPPSVMQETASPLPDRRLVLVRLPAAGQLDYTLSF